MQSRPRCKDRERVQRDSDRDRDMRERNAYISIFAELRGRERNEYLLY